LNTTTAILEIKNLGREVPTRNGSKTIVRNISYTFEKGRIYNILGPSGAGKSSFLRLLNRLDEPTRGQVVFMGNSYDQCPACDLRRQIGYLFQTPYLFPGTVRENLLYAEDKLTEENIRHLVKQCRIPPDIIDDSVENLSIGEKQRIALARLLAMKPEVILLDEPTSALDPTYTRAIENLIKSIVGETRVTVIMVTHNPEQALRMGGLALLLVAGELVETGTVDEVVNNPGTETGRRYKDKELQ